MKRLLAILLALLVPTFCVVGCSDKHVEEPQTPCEDLITQKIPLSDIDPQIGTYFNDAIHSGYHIHMDKLKELVAVECVRELKDSKYVVFEVDKGGRIYTFMRQKSDFVDFSIWVKEPLKWSDFKKLDSGDTIYDVADIDPVIDMYLRNETNMNVHVLMGENSACYPFSTHLLDDRFVIVFYEKVTLQQGEKIPREKLIVESIEDYDDYIGYAERESTQGGMVMDCTILDQDYVK